MKKLLTFLLAFSFTSFAEASSVDGIYLKKLIGKWLESNGQKSNVEILDDLQNNSVDYYAAVRSFYSQGRESQAASNLEIDSSEQENDIFDDFEIDESYVGPDIEITYD